MPFFLLRVVPAECDGVRRREDSLEMTTPLPGEVGLVAVIQAPYPRHERVHGEGAPNGYDGSAVDSVR